MKKRKFLKPKGEEPPLQPARRFGRIKIPSLDIDGEDTVEAFRKLGFIPWHCEYKGDEEVFDMMGTSTLFDLLPANSPAPYYDIFIAVKPGPGTEREIVIKVKQMPRGLKVVQGGKHGR